jgi:uncharacterized protein YbbC (DUF1343 family)
MKSIYLLLHFMAFYSCSPKPSAINTGPNLMGEVNKEVLRLGADRSEVYLPMLKDKRVGVVFNQTSMRGSTHMLDYFIAQGVNVKKIFALEHGIRGVADAGEVLKDGKDSKTGLPVVSLYGSTKKPTKDHLEDVDVVVFDIQDVGVRFYTYISSLHYIMQGCIDQNKPLMVFDRPNPHAHYTDGPLMDPKYKSFVGMHKVPIVYGLTIGEYATMMNEEGWLEMPVKCNLTIVKCENYDRNVPYVLPVKPSPNLPNHISIVLYPSICYFEGTRVSVGRGTNKQFQQIGMPRLEGVKTHTFTPMPNEGAKEPMNKGLACYGYDLSTKDPNKISKMNALTWDYVIDMYRSASQKNLDFFTPNSNFFEKLTGNLAIREMIIKGKSDAEIHDFYKPELEKYNQMRAKYLFY